MAEDARAFGWREAILVGAIVAGVVLGLAIGTSLLPADAQRLVFRTPLLIVDPRRGQRDRAAATRSPTPRAVTGIASPTVTAEPPVLAGRRRDLERLATERWDLLVVGGGITGSGILLDATSRGLKAALVERDDYAVGTSGRSSRLIHGGLRYLEQIHVGLVREALAERGRLLQLAPHLVRIEPFLFPLYGGPLTRPFFDAGLDDVRPPRRVGGRRATPPPLGGRGPRGDPGAPPAGPARGVHLSRRPGGRCPVHARRRPHRAWPAARSRSRG